MDIFFSKKNLLLAVYSDQVKSIQVAGLRIYDTYSHDGELSNPKKSTTQVNVFFIQLKWNCKSK